MRNDGSFGFIVFLLMLVGVFGSATCSYQERKAQHRMIDRCIAKQVKLYGDLIGEGDQDGRSIVKATGAAIKDCLDGNL